MQPALARSQGAAPRHLGKRVIAEAKRVNSSLLEDQAALLGCHRVAALRMHLGDASRLQCNLERSAANSRCMLFQAALSSCATPSRLNARQGLSKFKIKPCTLPDARLLDLKMGHSETDNNYHDDFWPNVRSLSTRGRWVTGGGEHAFSKSKNLTARAAARVWELVPDLAQLMLPAWLHFWRAAWSFAQVLGCRRLRAASAPRILAAMRKAPQLLKATRPFFAYCC